MNQNLMVIDGANVYIDENDVAQIRLEYAARGLGFTQINLPPRNEGEQRGG